MVMSFTPFQIMQTASLNIVHLLEQILVICQEISHLFPWISTSSLIQPPSPTSDVLKTTEDQRIVETAGLEALDIISFYSFCLCNHAQPLSPLPLDNILPWLRHALHGVVIDLESIMLPNLAAYLRHCVPVYYICHCDKSTQFPPQLVNVKDKDGELDKSHHDAIHAHKASKATAHNEC